MQITSSSVARLCAIAAVLVATVALLPVAANAATTYFTSNGDGTIRTYSAGGTFSTLVSTSGGSSFGAVGVAVDSIHGYVYWSGQRPGPGSGGASTNAGYVKRASATDGSSEVELWQTSGSGATQNYTTGITVNAATQTAYWSGVNNSSGFLSSGDATGATMASITSRAPAGDSALALDPSMGRIYWAVNGTGGSPAFSYTNASSISDGASTFANSNVTNVNSVAISPAGTTLYLVTGEIGRGSLMTAPTSGGTLASIGSAASGAVSSVAVPPDGATVYGAAFGLVTVTSASGTPGTSLSAAVTSGITAIAVCPAVAPGAPTAATDDAGDTIASVSWTAPTDTGGAPITRYTATASPGGATCTTTGATTCLFTGLKNGTAYTFTVTATNVAGTSAASAASTRVTPRKDNRARALTVGPATVTYTRKGIGVAFNVTATGPGVIAAAMTYKGDRYCSVSKRVAAAGIYRVRCVMKAAGRTLARKRTVTYTLNASFSPTNGPLASAKPSVVVQRRR